MEREDLAVGAGFGASLLIGACCVAPALFLLFGVSVGGLGMLSSLESYRPIFMAVGGAALLYAAWRAWRPASPEAAAAECAEGTCAPGSPRRRRTRQLVTFALIFYALAIAYPYAIAALL